MTAVAADGAGLVHALVVEGSAVAREVLARVMASAACQTVRLQAAATPQEAPGDLQRYRVALVDIDRDEAAALALISRLPASCWCVVTTLYDEEERLLPALHIGIHGYLLKQDRYERQVECLQRIWRGRPEMSPAIARSALESLRERQGVDPQTAQVLGALGRGLTGKETARAMDIDIADVEGTVARVFSAMRQPAARNRGRTA